MSNQTWQRPRQVVDEEIESYQKLLLDVSWFKMI